MAIPKFDEFFPFFIESLADGEMHSLSEIRKFCGDAFKISEEEREIRLKNGNNMLNDRIGWARTYLKKAGLIESPQRAYFKLTDEGKKSLGFGSEKITLKYLQRYESFREFFNGKNTSDENHKTKINMEDPTPIEMIDSAIQQLNSILADDLMEQIFKMRPFDFEDLVVKLLIKMGYGSLQIPGNVVTKKSGDEGIDGTVTSDRFGFETIYLQAKQWKPDSTVGRPDIQRFLGALVGQGARKGLFITTSRFSKEAIQYAEKQLNNKIVLVDGKLLTQLMIEYNLGVTTTSVYEVKQVSYEFFNKEE